MEPPPKEDDLDSWESFEERLALLRSYVRGDNAEPDSRRLLFRGQADSKWELASTLDRSETRYLEIAEHYRVITNRVKPTLQTFLTNTEFDNVPSYQDVRALMASNEPDTVSQMLRRSEIYRYMIYLRHHGFPSPLLDWSRSPYVAAFFAFREPSKGERRSIYAYCETPNGMKSFSSGQPKIVKLGPYVRAHRRHAIQQSDYTVCVEFEREEWSFVKHDAVFSLGEAKQDSVWKINLPGTERLKILQRLDEHNVNAYSLFDTEESLMETLAFREL